MHTKHRKQNSKNMHSGDHFGIAAVSTTNILLLRETPMCNVLLGTASTRTVTHDHLPSECWLCKAQVRMTGDSENVSLQHYLVSQLGVIISLLMAKWCSSCQEHRENDCLVSTMFLHNSNIVTHDKITEDLWWLGEWASVVHDEKEGRC